MGPPDMVEVAADLCEVSRSGGGGGGGESVWAVKICRRRGGGLTTHTAAANTCLHVVAERRKSGCFTLRAAATEI